MTDVEVGEQEKMKCTCKQCGKEFELEASEIRFYQSRNLELPKRCKECRNRNKQKRQKEVPGKSLYKVVTAVALILVLCIAFLFAKKAEQKEELPETEYTENTEKMQEIQTSLSVTFRNKELLNDHYEKHGKEMKFASAAEYEAAAAKVVDNPESLHKTEAEDGDDVYYLESTNEFVIVSTDGYIRTYFCPEDGLEYYNRQD